MEGPLNVMPRRTPDLTGQRFGRLTVMELVGRNAYRYKTYRVRCDCGNEKTLSSIRLKQGTSSCGCLHSEGLANRNRTHGLTDHELYGVWNSIKSRCLTSSCPSYKNYGGRGITICRRWLDGEDGMTGFECFVSDMGPRPTGYTVERKNNDGPYDPANCIWATRLEQNRNTRRTKNREDREIHRELS